jgi:hypothetical protein
VFGVVNLIVLQLSIVLDVTSKSNRAILNHGPGIGIIIRYSPHSGPNQSVTRGFFFVIYYLSPGQTNSYKHIFC